MIDEAICRKTSVKSTTTIDFHNLVKNVYVLFYFPIWDEWCVFLRITLSKSHSHYWIYPAGWSRIPFWREIHLFFSSCALFAKQAQGFLKLRDDKKCTHINITYVYTCIYIHTYDCLMLEAIKVKGVDATRLDSTMTQYRRVHEKSNKMLFIFSLIVNELPLLIGFVFREWKEKNFFPPDRVYSESIPSGN